MKPMSPLDAAMVAVESFSPPQHVAAILILKPPDGAGPGYVDQIYSDALSNPGPVDARLRRHAHRGIDTGGIYVWRDYDKLEIAEHVFRRTLAPGAGPDGFWALISEIYSERLDPERPLWSMYFVDGMDGGRFAIVVKVHHAVMDGVAGFQFISHALSPDPDKRSMPHIFSDRHEPEHDSSPAPKPSGGRRLPNPFGALRSLVDTATSSAELVENVVANLISGGTETKMASVGAPYTRFNTQVGEHRGLAAASWPKARIAAVRKKAGVSSNDVITAAIGGAVRRWLIDNHELPDRSLVALCPVTVRGRERGEDSEGNMFGLWLCPLGTDLDDPGKRLDLIHRSMSEGKDTVRRQGSVASLLTMVPTQIATVLSPRLPVPKIRTGSNIPITNVPGPQTDLYWNGAHVDEMYPVAMIFDGLAFTVTVCSYDDRISLTFLAGREVVPDLDRFLDLTENSLTELEAAVGVTGKARKARR